MSGPNLQRNRQRAHSYKLCTSNPVKWTEKKEYYKRNDLGISSLVYITLGNIPPSVRPSIYLCIISIYISVSISFYIYLYLSLSSFIKYKLYTCYMIYVCLSIYLSICLSVCLPACLSVCLSIHPTIHLSIFGWLSPTTSCTQPARSSLHPSLARPFPPQYLGWCVGSQNIS